MSFNYNTFNYNKMKNDLYDILGVDVSSTQDDIKKAYRKLSLQYHPDRNNGDAASTTRFQEIAAAYEILGDIEKRSDYNIKKEYGYTAFNPENMNINPEDLFKFFSSPSMTGLHKPKHGFTQTMLNKPIPIIKTVEITMLESYLGGVKPLVINRWIIENDQKREETETIYIDIPKGVDDNELIIIREKGNSSSDNNKGDIKIFVKIINTTEFTRKGLDLFYPLRISLKDALCGFTFVMKYIDGRTYKIKNGNGNVISPNYKKMLPNMGMSRGEHHTGNLIIEFEIAFPESISDKQAEELSKIL
jgi:DnaJ-class molecular chaperone